MVNLRLASWLAPVAGLLVVPQLVAAQFVSEPMIVSAPDPMVLDPIIGNVPGSLIVGPGGPNMSGTFAAVSNTQSPDSFGGSDRPRGTGDLIWPTLRNRGWQALRSFVNDEAARDERLNMADELFRAALEQLRPFKPGDDRVATTYTDLAWVFFLRDRFDDASGLADWALRDRISRLGPHDPRVGDSLILLSKIALEQDQFADAEALARRALTAYIRSSPGRDLDFHTPIALDTLGKIYLEQSKLDLAEAFIRRGLEWRQDMLENPYFDAKKDPMAFSEEARSYMLLASVLDKLGQQEEAQVLRSAAEADLQAAKGYGSGTGPAAAPEAPGPF